MSFVVQLGQISDSRNTLQKKPKFESSVSCVLKDQCSIKNPVLLISGLKISAIRKYNYAYIADFGRYYYITDIISVRNNLVELHLSCDVLYTFSSQIYEQNAIIERATDDSVYLPDLKDTDTYIYAGNTIVTKKLDSKTPFKKNGSFILVTAGPSASK